MSADILTNATPQGRAAAVDVGITSPEASAAGVDCTASMGSWIERSKDTLHQIIDTVKG